MLRVTQSLSETLHSSERGWSPLYRRRPFARVGYRALNNARVSSPGIRGVMATIKRLFSSK